MAQSENTITKFKNVTPAGYSQYVEIDLGKSRMLLISGQVPVDESGNIVGINDLSAQIEQTFQNIKSIVEQEGGVMADIVKINTYMTDVSKVQIFREIRTKYLNTKNPPASTLVGVTGLANKDFMIEIEATVIIAKK